jgi:hypothetical protein
MRSINGHLAAGISRFSSRQKQTAWGLTLSSFANFVTLPAMEMAS